MHNREAQSRFAKVEISYVWFFVNTKRSLIGDDVARPESEPKTPLGKRLRAVRGYFGDEDRELFASRLGISRAALAYYERGERVPDSNVLAAYRDTLGINLNWLASDSGEMFEDPSKAPRNSALERPIPEWLFNEFGKIVVREHKRARLELLPEMVAPESSVLYNELLSMVRDVTDRRMVEAVLPILAENLRERLRKAIAEPGTGKREAS